MFKLQAVGASIANYFQVFSAILVKTLATVKKIHNIKGIDRPFGRGVESRLI
jgi:hypothetical protein